MFCLCRQVQLPKAHHHKGIETIAYMLEGELRRLLQQPVWKSASWCARGSRLSSRSMSRTHRVTSAGSRVPGSWCTHQAVTRTAWCCCRSWMQNWPRGWPRRRNSAFCRGLGNWHARGRHGIAPASANALVGPIESQYTRRCTCSRQFVATNSPFAALQRFRQLSEVFLRAGHETLAGELLTPFCPWAWFGDRDAA